MIPILYEKDEKAFTSNGLARLRDVISCVVTEERNGVYELDFQYATTGANYDLIKVGRIVAVTHDDTGDVQPFDIVSFEKPIDNIVTFHCVHISYRLSYMTVTGTNINSLADAFTMFASAEPSNPFSFSTDKTSAGYLACMDGTPRTVRELMGGIEGSVLDTYGGEYEFTGWTVNLWKARGTLRDFTIRYGVNMLDYEEEYDITSSYTSCIPYWTDGTVTVVGDQQTSGQTTPTGRDECVPLDVSEKFESKPTKAQVNAMGLSVMGNPALPTQNITVSFVRLQELGYTQYDDLLTCGLCDTINVIFPDYNSGGQFKIVKTVWNVLDGKYEEMELGELSTTLSEALGISNTLDRTGGGSTPLPVPETETVTITRTAGGTITNIDAVKYGHVLAINITFNTSASTASGSNYFTGTIDSAHTPLVRAELGGYTSGKGIEASIGTNGNVIIRNASASATAAATGFNVSGIMII